MCKQQEKVVHDKEDMQPTDNRALNSEKNTQQEKNAPAPCRNENPGGG